MAQPAVNPAQPEVNSAQDAAAPAKPAKPAKRPRSDANYVPAKRISPAMLAVANVQAPAPHVPVAELAAADPSVDAKALLSTRPEAGPDTAPEDDDAPKGSILDSLRNFRETRERSDEANFSVRKACNSLKIYSSLISALIVRPGQTAGPRESADVATQLITSSRALTEKILEEIGHANNPSQPVWVERMVLVTASQVVADAWKNGVALDESYLNEQARALGVIARDNIGHLEETYRQSDDALDPARLSLLNALAPLLAEIEFYNLNHDKDALLARAAERIFSTAQEGVRFLVAEGADEESRLMLLQNLINNASRLYTAAYAHYSNEISTHLQDLAKRDLSQAKAFVAANIKGFDLAPMESAFDASFSRLVNTTKRLLQTHPSPVTGSAPARSPR